MTGALKDILLFCIAHSPYILQKSRPVYRHLEKGVNFIFLRERCESYKNPDFEAKIRGVNPVCMILK